MTLRPLRSDSLRRSADGRTELHVALPWIRSLPLASVRGLTLHVDGEPRSDVVVLLSGRRVQPAALADEPSWWFLQDRLVLATDTALADGRHEVDLAFDLAVPYLVGLEGPLALPFQETRSLDLRDRVATQVASRAVA